MSVQIKPILINIYAGPEMECQTVGETNVIKCCSLYVTVIMDITDVTENVKCLAQMSISLHVI